MEPGAPRPLLFGVFKRTSPPVFAGSAVLAFGLVAGALLLGGGLTALQTAAILAGLPFTIVLLLLCAGVWRALELEAAGGDTSAPGTDKWPGPK